MRAIVAFALCCCAPLRADTLTLTGATVYPSPEARPITNGVIIIQGTRIAGVGPRPLVPIPKEGRVVDCSGKYIVAGFWNSHVHIFTPLLLRARDASPAELNNELDMLFNRWGFTTVFDIASVLDNTLQLRRRIESGDIRGPRILTVGEPLWTEPPIYVHEYLKAHNIEISSVVTAEESAARVKAQTDAGSDGIKLFAGSVQGAGKVSNMPLEVMRAASRESHRRKLPVFAHPANSKGLESAIAGGVDILAHTAPGSPPWKPEFIARLRKARIALTPTLTLFDFEARKGRTSDEERERFVGKMVAQLTAFSEGGGEVLFGTDAGYTDHFDTALEFALMSRAGMSFRQILASLTTNPARRFGRGGQSGRIANGMEADLTVLESDPAADVTAFSRVRLTIRSGKITYPSGEEGIVPAALRPPAGAARFEADEATQVR